MRIDMSGDRLRLREFRSSDTEDLLRVYGDEETARLARAMRSRSSSVTGWGQGKVMKVLDGE